MSDQVLRAIEASGDQGKVANARVRHGLCPWCRKAVELVPDARRVSRDWRRWAADGCCCGSCWRGLTDAGLNKRQAGHRYCDACPRKPDPCVCCRCLAGKRGACCYCGRLSPKLEAARLKWLELEAFETDDEEAWKEAALARCAAGDHFHGAHGVCKVSDDGKLGAYCRWTSCPVCSICNQVMCEHAHLYEPRRVSFSKFWAEIRMEEDKADAEEGW